MRNIISSLFCLLFYFSIQGQTPKVDQVIEGIFYLDQSLVEIAIADGKIVDITRIDQLSDPNMNELYIAPGFIDHQVNGYLSYSFTGSDLTTDKVRQITQAFWEQGITTYLPTLTTQSRERLHKNFTILAEAIKDPEIAQSVPGFHLEGPYISPLDGFRGVHPKPHIRAPDWDEFESWYKASNQRILEVSVAPELEGAIDFIKKCKQQGIVVALGHHDGSAAIIKQATDAGASVSTHLGNGCANMIHRHDNPIWPQLADDRLMASIIVDGFHLRPEEVQTFYKVKGPENTLLVSDVVRLAGAAPGLYEDFETQVEVTADGMVRMPSQDVLAGASFLITKGIENIMSFTQCSLAEAIHMASRNPARLLGLEDRGEIAIGRRADLVLFTLTEGHIEIQATYVNGDQVYNKQ
ncbi:MAG: N-acetylglucosamine-6-phosphate deacetylase [Cyclobacteriaceae bacterium]